MESLAKFDKMDREGKLTGRWKELTKCLSDSLLNAAMSEDKLKADKLACTLIDKVTEQVHSPFHFAPFHKKVTAPFDYYNFGIEFIRPVIDRKKSRVLGTSTLNQITKQLKEGGNVILFGNHQSEFDPQILSLLLEDSHPLIAQEIIFVAGHRVTTDPIAIPFSLGRNLLCIYSKRRIDHPPEEKEAKLLHNKRTMSIMSDMLARGGVCIYVAPSGGRDRCDASGNVQIASFDGASVEMFALMARRARTPTHFYPLTLDTFHLLPPPAEIQQDLGEVRRLNYTYLQAAFGEEISFETIPLPENLDKKESREMRARFIHRQVEDTFKTLVSFRQ